MRAAITPPAANQGFKSQRRAEGSTKIHEKIPKPKKKLVYLESQPSPANNPTRSQKRGDPPREITERAHTASAQNIVEGASGVMKIAPTPIRIIALNQSTARRAIEREENNWRAVPKTAAEVTRTERIDGMRMPIALSPRTLVESHIDQATTGG
jgi:hypothetical protein